LYCVCDYTPYCTSYYIHKFSTNLLYSTVVTVKIFYTT